MSEENLIIWGKHGEEVHVGLYQAMVEIADEHELFNAVGACENWMQAQELLGTELLNSYFSAHFDSRWEDWCYDNDLEVAPRPDAWVPHNSMSDEMDIFLGGGRPDDPGRLGLPDDFFEFGTGGGNMLTGDWWVWSESDVPKLEQLAQKLGYKFQENFELVSRCIG